jgi:peptidoglycan/LPS O-acetylase OafA/YrhL
MDLLLAGVLLAVFYRSVELSRHVMLMRVLPLLALLMLFLLRLLCGAQTFTVFGSTIFGMGVAAFLGAILCGAPEGKRFRSPLLRYFGQISYCLYLLHQPVSGLLHGLILDRVPDIGSLAGFAVSLLAMGTSVGIAAASWIWFERPIMNWAQGPRGLSAGNGHLNRRCAPHG